MRKSGVFFTVAGLCALPSSLVSGWLTMFAEVRCDDDNFAEQHPYCWSGGVHPLEVLTIASGFRVVAGVVHRSQFETKLMVSKILLAGHWRIATFGCLAILAGCAKPTEPVAIKPLASSDLAANAPRLAQFIQQQCFDRSDNRARFDEALRVSGWNLPEMQKADPADARSLDYWRTPDIELLRGEIVKDGAYTCTVAVARKLAPPAALAKSALSKLAGHAPDSDGQWRWKRSATRELHMDINAPETGDPAVIVTVETYLLPWQLGLSG